MIDVKKIWSEYLTSLPDCSFEYTTNLRMPGEVLEHRRICEFTRCGSMFIQKEYSKEGDLQEIISFDGETFYSLFDSGSQLTISSERPEHQQRFAQRFKFNPLYVPLVAFSEGAFGLFTSDFYPPVISNSEIYSARLAAMRVPAPKLINDEFKWVIECNGATRLFASKGLGLADLTSVITNFADYGNRAERWNFESMRSIKVLSGEFVFPLKVVKDFVKPSGEFDAESPVCEIVVDPGSIKVHSTPLGKEVFRVPKSMARMLRDSDIGVSIPLNREIERD